MTDPDTTSTARDFGSLIRAGLIPYITAWSTEKQLPTTLIARPSGIGYTDETLGDRDKYGILWQRIPSQPGRGRPLFGQIHPIRQRRAMSRLLCQVCGGPADRTDDGVLWVLKDHREDWPCWPECMGVTEPPVCLPCAHTARRTCPALRKGHVAVRVGNSHVAGVRGLLYQPGPNFPESAIDALVAFDDPVIYWTRAAQLVRELHNCAIVNLDDHNPTT